MRSGVLAISLLILMASAVSAEIIRLKSGHSLDGDVLKEHADAIYVDIGIDVIRVPLNQIQSRTTAEESAHAAVTITDRQLYQEASLPRKSIRELAEEYGEGVVLIETPGGLGSGFIVHASGFCVTNYHVVEK
ncbi:MAG: peptidase S1, partial [Planctomycetales bacterium 12-60-4]